MNDIFNLHRFGLQFKKTLFEQPLQTFGLLGLAFIATFLLYHPYNAKTLSISREPDTMFFILFLSGGSLVFFLFSQFSDNAKGYNYLMLPSSYLEKWLCGFITSCVLFFGIYLVFFRLFDSYQVTTFHRELLAKAKDYSPEMVQNYLQQVQVQAYDSPVFKTVFSLFFIMTGVTALGSLYFNKNAFVKIFIVLMVSLWAYIYFNGVILEYFFKSIPISHTTSFDVVFLEKGGTIALPKAYRDIVDFVFYYGLPTALWLIVLIRLREKEI